MNRLILLLLGLQICFHSGCETAPPICQQPSDFQVQATSFFREFTNNQQLSLLKYQGKTLEIIGTITSIEHKGNQQFHILLNSNDKLGQIRCVCKNMTLTQLETLSVGQIIQVKGTFAEYESDITLAPCVII